METSEFPNIDEMISLQVKTNRMNLDYLERLRKVMNDENWRTFIELASNMAYNGIV